MITRQDKKMIVEKPDAEAKTSEMPTQIRRPDVGQFRLQVDRQTKASFPTLDAAQIAGLAIKQGFPNVQVTVYDSVGGANTTIEVSNS
jgi:hypothetical protein